MEVQNSADLTGIKKLVFEACKKIQDGEALMAQGNTELENLLGKAAPAKKRKTVANRTVRAHSTFHKNTQSDAEIADRIRKLVKKDPQISLTGVQNKTHVGERRLLRIMTSMKDMEVKDNKIVKVEAAQGGDDLKERIIEVVKNDPWSTLHSIHMSLKCDFYNLRANVRKLIKEKVIKQVDKKHNPKHEGKAGGSYNRERTYLEIV